MWPCKLTKATHPAHPPKKSIPSRYLKWQQIHNFLSDPSYLSVMQLGCEAKRHNLVIDTSSAWDMFVNKRVTDIYKAQVITTFSFSPPLMLATWLKNKATIHHSNTKLKTPVSQQPVRGKQGQDSNSHTALPALTSCGKGFASAVSGLWLCKQLPGGETLAQPVRGHCSDTATRGDMACPLLAS